MDSFTEFSVQTPQGEGHMLRFLSLLATGPSLQVSCRVSVPENRDPPPLGLVLTGCGASYPELLIQQAWAGPTKCVSTKSPGEHSLHTLSGTLSSAKGSASS